MSETFAVPPGVPVAPQGAIPQIGIESKDYPRLVFAAPYFTQVPLAELITPSVIEAVEAELPSLVPPYVDQAAQDAVSQLAVLRAGDTMTGPLFLSPTMPTQPAEAASMAYVDSMVATGNVPEVPTIPTGQTWARQTGQWVPIESATGVIPEPPPDGVIYGRNGQVQTWTAVLPLSGGTLTGPLTLPGNATQALQAVPLQQLGAQLGAYVPLAGSVSILGPLTMLGVPATFTLHGNAAANLEAVPLQQLTSTLALYAPLASPSLTGTPTVPTAAAATSTTQAASTAFVHAVTGGYLPLSGGTVAGNLTVNGAAIANSLTIAGAATASTLTAATSVAFATATDPQFGAIVTGPAGEFRNIAFASNYAFRYDSSVGSFNWVMNGADVLDLDFAGNLNFPTGTASGNLVLNVGHGFQPGGGEWSATSDDRTKRDVQQYTGGLAEILLLRPVSYCYNGEGGTTDDGRRFIGLSAQATRDVMPELVREMTVASGQRDLLPGQLATQLGPLTLALVNAVQELAQRVGGMKQ